MIRIWFFVWYLDRYTKYENNAQSYPTILRFREYLAFEKYFLEDWRDFFIRHYYRLKKQQRPQSELGLKLTKEQWNRIGDVINDCMKRKLIKYESFPRHAPFTTNTKIWTDYRSRRFLRSLKFFNEALKEYGYFTAFIFGAGGVLILGILDIARDFLTQLLIK